MTIMKLKYETSIVTFGQFIIMSVLYFAINLGSIINVCTTRSYDCLSNTISSLTLSILIAFFFVLIWILGYLVQHRRSQRLALLLICLEFGVLIVELFDAHNYPSLLSLVTSILDAFLALWVISLAIRLYRAKGGRIVSRSKSLTEK